MIKVEVCIACEPQGFVCRQPKEAKPFTNQDYDLTSRRRIIFRHIEMCSKRQRLIGKHNQSY